MISEKKFKKYIQSAERAEKKNNLESAHKYYLMALEARPDNREAIHGFVRLGKDFTPNAATNAMVNALLKSENDPQVVPQTWFHAATRVLFATSGRKNLVNITAFIKQQAVTFISPPHESEKQLLKLSASIGRHPFWIRIISHSFFSSMEIENVLTTLRRTMFKWWLTSPEHRTWLKDQGVFDLLCAITMQCFWNEHLYSEAKEEAAAIDRLKAAIEDAISKDAKIASQVVTLYGCYRDLFTLKDYHRLRSREWPPSLERILIFLIDNPLKEQSYEFPALTTITEEISQKVRAQYEEHPYPRWSHAPTTMNQKKLSKIILESTGFEPEPLPLNADTSPSILIAGCGTGQQIVIAAMSYKNPKILAIDLSLASLGYAKRKIEEMGLKNIEFAQADILEMSSCGRKFDLIESMGVLHHLKEPHKGAAVLCQCLNKGGIFVFGLYSQLARQDIARVRKQFDSIKKVIDISDNIIRQYREILKTKALERHEMAMRLINFRDFYSLSQCRDLLFHVNEHTYTLPRINDELLKPNGLVFKGLRNIDIGDYKAFLDQNRWDESAIYNIDAWNKFEEKHPETFLCMYQFWSQKVR